MVHLLINQRCSKTTVVQVKIIFFPSGFDILLRPGMTIGRISWITTTRPSSRRTQRDGAEKLLLKTPLLGLISSVGSIFILFQIRRCFSLNHSFLCVALRGKGSKGLQLSRRSPVSSIGFTTNSLELNFRGVRLGGAGCWRRQWNMLFFSGGL